MPDILMEQVIEVSPDKVYEAITTAEGVKGWWTQRVQLEPREGSVADFRFYGGDQGFRFNVDKLKANEHVKWSVKDGGPPDWAGTHVTWDLMDVEGHTKVLLGHRNYQTTEGSYPMITTNWAWFFFSLKAYLETGKGTPDLS